MEVLLKLYEVGAQHITQHETTVVFQLIITLLTAVGVVVWYLLKDPSKESEILAGLRRAPVSVVLTVILMFFWTLQLGLQKTHIFKHGWENLLIEQRLSKYGADQYGTESSTIHLLGGERDMLTPFDEFSCYLLLPSVYREGYCHDGALGTLGYVIVGDLALALVFCYLIGGSLIERLRKCCGEWVIRERDIFKRAYALYEKRKRRCQVGSAEDDWLKAEAKIKRRINLKIGGLAFAFAFLFHVVLISGGFNHLFPFIYFS